MPLMRGQNPNEPDRQFINFVNNQGAQLNKDTPVQWDISAGNYDGVKCVLAVAGGEKAFAGIVDQAVPNGEAGLIQVSGPRTTARVIETVGAQSAGLALKLSAGNDYLEGDGTPTAGEVVAVLAQDIPGNASPGVVTAPVFIRGL